MCVQCLTMNLIITIQNSIVKMEKKARLIAPMTPEQEAEQRANQIKGLRTRIESDEVELEKIVKKQIAYMQSLNVTELDGLKIVKTAGRTTITGLSGKELAQAKTRLAHLVSEKYKSVTLNEEEMFSNIEFDCHLLGALTKTGLHIKQGEASYTLREALNYAVSN